MKTIYTAFIFTLFLLQLRGQNLVEGFQKGWLKEAHIDSVKLLDLNNKISRGGYNVHSLLVFRNNKIVFEKYFTGKDEIFAMPLGDVNHTRDSLHDCRSLTKSVVSACIGIAIAQHKIKSVDDKVLTYFPEYRQYDTGMKHNITIRDLLTMTAGIEWNENIPYSNPNNSEIQMLMQKDVIGYALSRPSVAQPGTVWNYSAACTQLLAEIIQKIYKQKIDSFAKKNLFQPLGIDHFTWYKREDGKPWAPSGLRRRSIDMAKFGAMYLNNGKWNKKQILSPEWVQQSFKWQVNGRSSSQGYGYQFWCWKATIAKEETLITAAVGFGGQRIYLIPKLNMEIIITAGNYNDLSDLPDQLVTKYIFPAVE